VTCQSFNVPGLVGIVCERLAQDRHCDVNASVVVHEGIVRPKDLPYFLTIGSELKIFHTRLIMAGLFTSRLASIGEPAPLFGLEHFSQRVHCSSLRVNDLP